MFNIPYLTSNAINYITGQYNRALLVSTEIFKISLNKNTN